MGISISKDYNQRLFFPFSQLSQALPCICNIILLCVINNVYGCVCGCRYGGVKGGGWKYKMEFYTSSIWALDTKNNVNFILHFKYLEICGMVNNICPYSTKIQNNVFQNIQCHDYTL
jgi:hypothetical protein